MRRRALPSLRRPAADLRSQGQAGLPHPVGWQLARHEGLRAVRLLEPSGPPGPRRNSWSRPRPQPPVHRYPVGPEDGQAGTEVSPEPPEQSAGGSCCLPDLAGGPNHPPDPVSQQSGQAVPVGKHSDNLLASSLFLLHTLAMQYTVEQKCRFDAKVDRSGGARSCWPWTGDASRYGHVKIRGHTTSAHRIAYEMTMGNIPAGMFVLHSCDNPLCCNPAHLRPGTAAENAKDRDAKGRGLHGRTRNPCTIARGDSNGARKHPEQLKRGEDNNRAKLTAANVVLIRGLRADGWSLQSIGSRFGVTKQCIRAVVRRSAWKHIP